MAGPGRIHERRMLLILSLVVGLCVQGVAAPPAPRAVRSTNLAAAQRPACCRVGRACCGHLCCRPPAEPRPASPALPGSNNSAEPRGLSLLAVTWHATIGQAPEHDRHALAACDEMLYPDDSPVARHIRLQI